MHKLYRTPGTMQNVQPFGQRDAIIRLSSNAWRGAVKQWLNRILQTKPIQFARKRWLVIGGVAGGLMFVFLLWTAFAPQTVSYAYGRDRTCLTSPRLLPGLSRIDAPTTFQLSRSESVAIGKFVIYSHAICAEARQAPQPNKTLVYRERLFGSALLPHRVSVASPAFPSLAQTSSTVKEVPPQTSLSLTLSAADRTFTYIVALGEAQTPCKTEHTTLTCDLSPLALDYARAYDLAVLRQYRRQTVSTLATVPIRTITPTSVIQTSINAQAVVQDKPTQIVIHTDKKLQALGEVQLVARASDGKETPVPITVSFADTVITVSMQQELARKVGFELRIASARAADGSGFMGGKPFVLPFTTSGGPKVQRANIGSRNVGQTQAIVVTFDQVLLPTQAVAPNVAFSVNGQPQAASFTISGSTLTIKPSAALPLCAAFSIKINANIQNQFGIAGDSAWAINSRAICYTTFSIGSSVRGRTLTAYRFGSGPEMIVYMGAMHGSEANSKRLMDEWFSELNAGAERIPAHRSIVIIPSVNPDGVAAGTRFNARGVDLNRNFPANDWKSVVTTPDSSQPTAAGGPSPLSEPESQAVAAFLRQHRPRLVLSFHSKAAVVEANEAGDSTSIAVAYASRAKYRAVPKSQSAPIFQYDTTGAMEDWLRDAYGWPALVIELASSTSSEFSRNRDALWYSVRL